MERLLEAARRALNTLKVIAITDDSPQIAEAINELVFAINEINGDSAIEESQ